MKDIRLFLTVFLVAAALVRASAMPNDDRAAVRRLADRFACYVRNHATGTAAETARLVATLREDGTWPDVDYVTNERGYCPKFVALERMRTLAAAGETTAYRRTLGWFLRTRPTNPNWWWNDIGFPAGLGEGALMVRGSLTTEELRGVCEVLRVSDACRNRTGQNKVWLERIRLMRALLEGDAALVRAAVGAIGEEITLGAHEGVQTDWCFHQHGSQPQFGNYGLSFIFDITGLTVVLEGTPFAFSPEKRAILRGLLENGYRWICWRGCMDVSAMGRQIVPDAQRTKAASVARILREFATIDPAFPVTEPTGFRYFDKSAYAVYRTPTWMASVRMATTKIIGTETQINCENIRGEHLCDGALLTYVTGREYDNVTPLWGAWRHIPGITTHEDPKPCARLANMTNGSDDVRGWEENGEGIVFMELKRNGLRALKSWRFSPRGISCEGHEIASDDPREVITTVEEAWAADGAKLLPYDGRCVRAINGNVGYVIEAHPEEVCFAVEEREGDFRLTHPRQPSFPVKGKVFSLVISHGVRPRAGHYRYRVLPDATEAEVMRFLFW